MQEACTIKYRHKVQFEEQINVLKGLSGAKTPLYNSQRQGCELWSQRSWYFIYRQEDGEVNRRNTALSLPRMCAGMLLDEVALCYIHS